MTLIRQTCWAAVCCGLALAAPSNKEGESRLQRAVRAKDEVATLNAVMALGQHDSAQTARALIKFASKLDPRAYETAVEVASRLEHPEAITRLHALADERPHHQLFLVDVLAKRADEPSITLLGSLLKRELRPEVVRAALLAIPRSKAQFALRGVLEQLEHQEAGKHAAGIALAQQTLTRLTWQAHATAKDWKTWWFKVRAGYKAPTKRPEYRALPKPQGQGEWPQLFGQAIRSERLVIVVDLSFANALRVQALKNGLYGFVRALPDSTQFTILTMQSQRRGFLRDPMGIKPTKIVLPKDPSCNALSKRLQPAKKKHVERALKFVDALERDSGTALDFVYAISALKRACQLKGADTVVFLSSGFVNEPKNKAGAPFKPEEVAAQVLGHNRTQRCTIHVFDAQHQTYRRAPDTPLAEVAARTGGVYRTADGK